MDFLPNYTRPLPDETFYSWLLRLARANGLSVEDFACIYCGKKEHETVHLNRACGFFDLYSHLPFKNNMKDLFLSTSTINFDMIAKTTSMQTRYLNLELWPEDPLNVIRHWKAQTVRICPDCMKEDMSAYGTPYFHRNHQLEGVSVCYKHHVPLLVRHKTWSENIDFSLDNYTESQSPFSIEDSIAYAEYVCNLFQDNIQTDIAPVRDAIEVRLNELGMDSLHIQELFIPYAQKWEHKALMAPYDYRSFFIRRLRQLNNVSIAPLILVIMCLWPNVKDFENVVKGHEPILNEYVCQKCGHTYLATPQSQRDGWGCPYCMQGISVQERFNRLVQTMGNGEYELLTPFVSLDTKVTMKHIPCGQDLVVTPKKFLFHGQRCTCYMDNERKSHAQQMVRSLPGGFKLLKYNGYREKATIYCEKCGGTFECFLPTFKLTPYCHLCDRPRSSVEEYKEQVKELVGDEYEVVGRSPDDPQKLILRHNVCGCEQAYEMNKFRLGARCSQCTVPTPHIDLLEMIDEYSHGRYLITDLMNNYVMIYDAMTQKKFRISILKLLQELRRPTPSPVLPLDPKWDSSNWIPYWNKMLSEFRDRLSMNSLDGLIYEMDDLFSEWLRRQLDKWSKGDLSEERKIDLLKIAPCLDDYIPFSHLKDNKRWMQSYEIYKEYIDDHGKVRSGTKYKGLNLSSWKTVQRTKDREGKLSKHRRDLLLSADPHIFDPRKSGKENKT